jgi:hypothetical protein
MRLTTEEKDLINKIVDEITGQLAELRKRVKELESRQPIVNNYYTYTQPAPIWSPTPSYPTWTCKT